MQAVIGSLQARLFERALKLRLLTLQELQRVGAVGGHMRGDLAVAIDVKTNVDAAKLGRVEPDVELVGAGLRPRRDRDRQPGNRNGGSGAGIRRCRGRQRSKPWAPPTRKSRNWASPAVSDFAGFTLVCVFDASAVPEDVVAEDVAVRGAGAGVGGGRTVR